MGAAVYGAAELYDGYSALQLQRFVDELALCAAAEAGAAGRRPRVRVPHDAPSAGEPGPAPVPPTLPGRPPLVEDGLSDSRGGGAPRLSAFPASRIDLAALRALAREDGRSELVELLRMLDDPAAFAARLRGPRRRCGGAGPPSRRMAQHAAQLVREGAARVARRGEVRCVLACFPRPKKDPAELRFLVNAVPLNAAMERPPTFSLPTPVQLAARLLGRGHRCAAKVDMRGFYYQFAFANGVERWWGLRFGGGVVLLMTVMAMGWSFACCIAQWTMELLIGPAMRASAVAWIDDGLLPGADAARADADAAVFRSRCARVNALVAESKSHAARPVVEAFGMVWNFPGDFYSLPVAWREKAAALIRATCALGSGSAKSLWRCVGVALWAAVALRVRLHRAADLIAWVS
eukprot:gene51285-63985_t